MPEAGPILSNPSVASAGIGGLLAIILIFVMYRMLVRIDDSIHAFTEGQTKVIVEIGNVGERVARAVAEALDRIHNDNLTAAKDLGMLHSKLDVLLERSSRIYENVAFHRGVAEPPITGQPPAIINPRREEP